MAVNELRPEDVPNCVEIMENEDFDAASTSYNFLETGEWENQNRSPFSQQFVDCFHSVGGSFLETSSERNLIARKLPNYSSGVSFLVLSGSLNSLAICIGAAAGILLVFLIVFSLVLSRRDSDHNRGQPVTATKCQSSAATEGDLVVKSEEVTGRGVDGEKEQEVIGRGSYFLVFRQEVGGFHEKNANLCRNTFQ